MYIENYLFSANSLQCTTSVKNQQAAMDCEALRDWKCLFTPSFFGGCFRPAK